MAMETPWADEKLLVGASGISSDVLASCIISDHPVGSIGSTKKNTPTDGINQAEHLQSVAYQDYLEMIMELNDRLDMVKDIVRPGCSYEVLNTALIHMSSLVTFLSKMSQKLQASL